MVAATERGLLLTTLWYIREVDPQTLLLTGLTRDGVFLVEGGEVTGAVNNFRFNESPVDLLGPDGPGQPHRAHAAAGVERLVHPAPPCRAAGAGLQHELGVARQLTGRASAGAPADPSVTPVTPAVVNGGVPPIGVRDTWEVVTATLRGGRITLGAESRSNSGLYRSGAAAETSE